MKIAIIDDLVECRNAIQSCLYRFFSKHYVEEFIHIEEFISGEDFLSIFRKDSYDTIFIDQYMDGLSGIDTAKKIRMNDTFVPLIFITTSRDHAIDSYQVAGKRLPCKTFFL